MTNTEKFFSFIDSSPTSFQAVSYLVTQLSKAGYHELSENEEWHIQPGGKYFTVRNQSSLAAFRIPENQWKGYLITASHCDSPSFKVKEIPESMSDPYIRLNCEKYGAPILSTWLDRSLSIAGRIVIQNDADILQSVNVSLPEYRFIIPNAAIHLQNQSEYHLQKDFLPLFSTNQESCSLLQLIGDKYNLKKEKILSHDLFLYNAEKPFYSGSHKQFYSAPRIDDLGCVFSTFTGFLETESENNSEPMISAFAVFDNEEVGNTTKQGAASTFLENIIKRISSSFNQNEQKYFSDISQSFLLSADNVHAVHPNHPELTDEKNNCYLNHGIVIKRNAGQKYTTDAISSSHIQLICKKNQIPYQHYANRSDLPGGSTLGNIVSSNLSLHAADIGLPQLAMHSCLETAGVQDIDLMIQFTKSYYKTPFDIS